MPSGAKKTALILASTAAIAAVVIAAMPKRRDAVARWTRGEIEVARGCTVFTPGIFDHEDRFEAARKKIRELQRDGAIAMYDTPIGSYWYPVAWWTLPVVVETDQADTYALRSTVKPGDIVLDVGAGVGAEASAALSAGAALVVAIEPDPVSLECLRRNLISEIREKRVVVVPKGASDWARKLPLSLDVANGGGSSFAWKVSDRSVEVPVTTIDRIVSELNLSKVSFMKIHVEGSEEAVLAGATATIRRDHPRLAVSLEHHVNDAEVLPAVARRIWPGYRVELTPCTKTLNRIHHAVALLSP